MRLKRLLFAVVAAVIFFACSKHNSVTTPGSTSGTGTPQVVSLSSFSPASAPVDSTVTIVGANFSPNITADTVRFDDTPATVKFATDSELVVIVPAGTSTGKITVTVGNQTATSANNFIVSDQWTLKSAYPGTVMGYTVSFTVGTKLYIGLGEGAFGASMGTWLQEFWQYDAVSGVWTRKANYPGMTAGYGIGFSVGGYGYVFNNPDSNGAPGLWQYDTATDSWVVKASLPLGPEQGMVAFGVNGYGYVGLGTLDADFNNTIWQYDPTTNTWSQKNNFPGRATSFTASFVVGNYAYVGTGEVGLNTDSATTAFYQYNPATDTWTQKGNFPGGARNSATGFSIGNMGYLGTGLDINGHYLSDFWQYNAASDSWARKSDFGGGGRFAAAGFSGANLGYMGFGQGFDQISPNEATNVFFDLWQYQP